MTTAEIPLRSTLNSSVESGKVGNPRLSATSSAHAASAPTGTVPVGHVIFVMLAAAPGATCTRISSDSWTLFSLSVKAFVMLTHGVASSHTVGMRNSAT